MGRRTQTPGGLTLNEFDRIVIATDGSPHSHAALRKGLSIARLLKRPVLGVYVIDTAATAPYPNEGLVVDLQAILHQEAARALDEFQKQADKLRVKATTRVLKGHPEEEIVNSARATDLIVIATHGRSGFSRLLLGSVAENVVRHAPCPVLVVREPRPRKR